MKILFMTTHKFAPELNTITITDGRDTVVEIKAPSITSVKQARKVLFNSAQVEGLHCRISSVYDEGKFSFLDKPNVASGKVSSRLEAYRFGKKNCQQAGGKLLDGSVLPPNKLIFKFKY